MRTQQKLLLITGIIFFLYIISYKYSLFHTTPMLPYLNTPDTVPPFAKLLTYILMIIGLPPTILLILYTTFLCHTTLVNEAVQIFCFGSPFTLSAGNGFFAYIVASIVATGIFYSIIRIIILSSDHTARPHK
jgi:hypothetical protein